MLLLLSADFFQNDLFKKKILPGTLSQSVKWFRSRSGPYSVGPDLSPNCFGKSYQHMEKVAASKERVKQWPQLCKYLC